MNPHSDHGGVPMPLSHAAVGSAKLFVLALGGMGLAFTLPDPVSLLTFAGSAGMALGTAAGAFYGAWLKGTVKARAEAYAAMDEAHKASTLAKLEAATAEMAAMRESVARLNADLAAERDEGRKTRTELEGFALAILRNQGHVQERPKL